MNKDDLIKAITTKSGFPFYVDYWQQYFSRLSGEQCKEVLKIVFEFGITGESQKSPDFAVDLVANAIMTNIARDAKKREKRILASQLNGKKGGRPQVFVEQKKEIKKFISPSVDEVRAYCLLRKNSVDAEKFVNHYTSNGWKVGKNPMKDWQASIRTWEKKENESSPIGQKSISEKWNRY